MAESVTTGWLVEHGPTHGPAYLRFGPRSCSPGWTMDPFKAVRFARREDAEAAKQTFIDDIGRVVEHTFVEDPAHA